MDINECGKSRGGCHINAACNNLNGTYACLCARGYYGNGTWCGDVDECATNTHSCHANADCTNTNGAHTCACKKGYEGDGKSCKGGFQCINFSI